MKRAIKVLRRAERDLQQIYETLAREYGDRADEYFDRLLDRIASLGELAARGAQPRDPALVGRGLRFVIAGPHLVFFKVTRSQVHVYRVLHAHRAYRHLL
ncbi:MAG: type II toxin-antitoxin system RelE/ParE family toxin [Myxococcales bacterium]|nr:type II toxin-antitoxin system RelE/ParE family toxin [Myxococcales bacterium]